MQLTFTNPASGCKINQEFVIKSAGVRMSKRPSLPGNTNGEDPEPKNEYGAVKFENDDSCIVDESTSLEDLDEPDGWFGFKISQKQSESKLQTKVAECESLIKKQLEMKEANVNDYLESAQGNLDKGQRSRLKSNFERTNQKCSHNIEYFRKKKDGYLKRLKDMEKRRMSLTSVNGSLNGSKRPSISVSSTKSLTSKASTPLQTSGSADDVVSATDNQVPSKTTTTTTGQQSVKRHLATESLRMTSLLIPMCKSRSAADLSPRTEYKEFISQNTCNSNPKKEEPKTSHDRREFHLAKQKIKELNENNKRLSASIVELQMKMEGIHEGNKLLIEEQKRRNHLQKNMFDLLGKQQEEITSIRMEFQNIEEQIELKVYEKGKEIQKTIESCQYQIFQLEHSSSSHHLELFPDDNFCTKHLRQFAITALDHLLTFVAAIFIVLATMASNLRHYQLNASWSQKFLAFFILACIAGAFIIQNITWDHKKEL